MEKLLQKREVTFSDDVLAAVDVVFILLKVTANVSRLVLPRNFFFVWTKRKVIIKANIFRRNENKISNRARVIEEKRFINKVNKRQGVLIPRRRELSSCEFFAATALSGRSIFTSATLQSRVGTFS